MIPLLNRSKFVLALQFLKLYLIIKPILCSYVKFRFEKGSSENQSLMNLKCRLKREHTPKTPTIVLFKTANRGGIYF